MIEAFEWLSTLWSHRMQSLLCWSLILPAAWLATVSLRRLSPRVRSWIWRLAYLKLLLVLVSPVALELPIRPLGSEQRADVQESITQSPAVGRLDTTNGTSGHALQATLFSLALAWCLGVLYLAVKYFAGWRLRLSLSFGGEQMFSRLASCCGIQETAETHVCRHSCGPPGVSAPPYTMCIWRLSTDGCDSNCSP